MVILPGSNLEDINAQINISAFDIERKGLSLDIFFKMKKMQFYKC